jgi:hypothetical protein
MSTQPNWFTVDKKGLAQLQARRPKAAAIVELISNAWDQDVTAVEITLVAEGRGKYRLTVIDNDPNGFADLTHAFTLFIASTKKADVEKRGRFNLGEKLVLALCESATISSTTGTIIFDPTYGRSRTKVKRDQGSEFSAIIKMTAAEVSETCDMVETLIPPAGVYTTFNGVALVERTPVHEFKTTLPTEIADEEGNLRRTQRMATVRLFDPIAGETPTIYELGIPVVASGDRWHCDIGQKIPLNMDRDNVTPGFLRTLRTAVANEMHDRLSTEDANSTWAREALADKRISDDAVRSIIEKRFGDKAVIYDPSDPEANSLAVAKGYSLVHGRNLSGREWANVKRTDVLSPAGQVTPSSSKLLASKFSPDGVDRWVPEERWTPEIHRVVTYARHLGGELLGFEPDVSVLSDIAVGAIAFYSNRSLTFNLGRLGHKWFKKVRQAEIDELLIHEFAHDKVSNHLDDAFADECCRLGAKLRTARSHLSSIEEKEGVS